ncbi:MAG: MATE family efflux transporter, partial [Clostridiales bacterium]|nr:MATE family efflux transporter [Clostridiales bacterium]
MKESNQTNNEQNNPLASAPLKSLLIKYSIPTTITLMVNYLYNIVDQIFVGQGV